MQPPLSITQSCSIANGCIFNNQELVYEETPGSGAQAFLLNAYKNLLPNYPKFFKMDTLSKLGWLAAEYLLKEEVWNDILPEEKTILLCNASASLDTDKKYYQTIAKMASPALFVYTLPNIVMGEISIRHGFKGENVFFVQESFDADFLMQQVGLVMAQSQNKACLCGWVETMDDAYDARLLLVEKSSREPGLLFNPENIRKSLFLSKPE